MNKVISALMGFYFNIENTYSLALIDAFHYAIPFSSLDIVKNYLLPR